MKINLKQLLCEHIWEQINMRIIRKGDYSFMGIPQYEMTVQLVTFECVKCHKRKFIEQENKRVFSAKKT